MKNKIISYAFLFVIFFINISTSHATDFTIDKIYIDEDDFSLKEDAFHIHIGNNVWLVTNTITRDTTGLFTYECNLNRSIGAISMSYEKQWKCPYCYRYWPIGKPCSNKDCPSKYKP